MSRYSFFLLVTILLIFLFSIPILAEEVTGLESGELLDYHRDGDFLILNYENATGRVDLINNGLIHIAATFEDEFPEKYSYAVVNETPFKDYELIEDEKNISLKFFKSTLTIDKESFKGRLYMDDKVIYSFSISKEEPEKIIINQDYRDERFFGLGEKTGDFELTGRSFTMYNFDNLGLAGVPFAGADIGGYTGAPTEELFTRWIQLGTFVPFMRVHTERATPRQEPYVFENNLVLLQFFFICLFESEIYK